MPRSREAPRLFFGRAVSARDYFFIALS